VKIEVADKPFVTLIVPVRNEVGHIGRFIEDLMVQDYPMDRLEVIIADGMSDDGTREELKRVIGKVRKNLLQVVENTGRIVSTGLNAAIRVARGDIIIRMDVRCVHPQDYITKLVELSLKTKAENVGGVLVAKGDLTYAQRAICAAYRSPISGVGALRSREEQEDFTSEVDTVYGGCWRKQDLLEQKMFDDQMVRNQDDELSFRILASGGKIIRDTSIRVEYYVRTQFIQLFRQFFQYGYWKVAVIRKHPKQASLRHIIPATFVLSLLFLSILSIVKAEFFVGLVLLCTAYILVILFGSLVQCGFATIILWPGVMLVLALMHLGYGIGFCIGSLRMLSGNFYDEARFSSQLTR